mgnify:CR=1 FL=1
MQVFFCHGSEFFFDINRVYLAPQFCQASIQLDATCANFQNQIIILDINRVLSLEDMKRIASAASIASAEQSGDDAEPES